MEALVKPLATIPSFRRSRFTLLENSRALGTSRSFRRRGPSCSPRPGHLCRRGSSRPQPRAKMRTRGAAGAWAPGPQDSGPRRGGLGSAWVQGRELFLLCPVLPCLPAPGWGRSRAPGCLRPLLLAAQCCSRPRGRPGACEARKAAGRLGPRSPGRPLLPRPLRACRARPGPAACPAPPPARRPARPTGKSGLTCHYFLRHLGSTCQRPRKALWVSPAPPLPPRPSRARTRTDRAGSAAPDPAPLRSRPARPGEGPLGLCNLLQQTSESGFSPPFSVVDCFKKPGEGVVLLFFSFCFANCVKKRARWFFFPFSIANYFKKHAKVFFFYLFCCKLLQEAREGVFLSLFLCRLLQETWKCIVFFPPFSVASYLKKCGKVIFFFFTFSFANYFRKHAKVFFFSPFALQATSRNGKR